MQEKEYKYLFEIDSPIDLKKIPKQELKVVCDEIRAYMIDVISQIGGHFGAGLGAIELTVALHYVLNTPKDKIIWDVGHQAYPHKILTGRRDALKTIRQFGGISGFLKRNESEYDVFGAGHASTSISAAVGIAAARDFNGENHRVVAVIGDGAMTGGMAYEAMNNAGLQKRNITVILNDNNMSIANNVWQVSNYFTGLIANPSFNKFKADIWDLTGKLDEFGDRIRKIVARVEGGVKAIITPGALFEAFGFRYFGPINGHNINQLTKILEYTQNLNGPILIHVTSQKGKGYKPAEDDSQKLHGVTPFDKITGQTIKSSNQNASYTKIFGDTLVELAKANKKIIGITAAMPDGTGLDALQKEIPERFFDVGIAEQHAVTFAAGLAAQGMIPVVAIYSTFLQRAFDQIIHDVALQKLHVVFILDRAGLVGADGPTHHGTFDLSYLRFIPNITIMAPKDESELRDMLFTAIEKVKGPVAIRYPRGNALGVPIERRFTELEIGKSEVIKTGTDAAIISVGTMADYAIKSASILEVDGISIEIVNLRFVKPLDTAMLDRLFKRFEKIFVIEENSIVGGAGSAILEYAAKVKAKTDIHLIGLPDEFVEHGTQPELHRMLKLDPQGISESILIELRQFTNQMTEL
ncbi:MAG: 1-deoxy-D-xylulose-5-phosphate synthase [Ignavibacteria bacterium]|nr:1-deoxy-D-xylulose-5-phosphate synthase [Ignavibacteria bacterium]